MEEDHNDRDGLVALFDIRHRRRPRAPAVRLRRQNPTDPGVLSDRAFKSHYRFDKESVRRLAGLLDLGRQDDRGRPLSPIQQLCVALNFYGGGHYTRVAGLCGGVSQAAAWNAIERVTNALLLLKDQFIRLPTDAEAAASAQRNFRRYRLPR
jgi:hypothetical protein